MLRPDRGILRIGGDGEEITRSSRVMTEREENVGDNDRERKMSGNGRKKGKVGNCYSTWSNSGLTGTSGKLAATAVRGLPDQVG